MKHRETANFISSVAATALFMVVVETFELLVEDDVTTGTAITASVKVVVIETAKESVTAHHHQQQ